MAKTKPMRINPALMTMMMSTPVVSNRLPGTAPPPRGRCKKRYYTVDSPEVKRMSKK